MSMHIKRNENYGSTTCIHLSFNSVEFSMGIIKYDLYVNNFSSGLSKFICCFTTGLEEILSFGSIFSFTAAFEVPGEVSHSAKRN